MADLTTVTIDSTTQILSIQIKLTHTGDIYNRYIYKIILMHCSVIFMHIILYNMLFKRDMPFLRHDDKKEFEEIILLLFIALSKSKDYKCFAKMVSRLLTCFITVTSKVVTLNKGGEGSTVI